MEAAELVMEPVVECVRPLQSAKIWEDLRSVLSKMSESCYLEMPGNTSMLFCHFSKRANFWDFVFPCWAINPFPRDA